MSGLVSQPFHHKHSLANFVKNSHTEKFFLVFNFLFSKFKEQIYFAEFLDKMWHAEHSNLIDVAL